jgi:hypothetical protein
MEHYGVSIDVGRQRLSTPLINDHDLRALPSVYEALVVKSSNIENTKIELGYIKKYSGFVSAYNGFSNEETKWGEDGIGYIYLQNSSLKNTKFRVQYASNIDDEKTKVKDYLYADMKYIFDIDYKPFVEFQYGSNSYNNSKSSSMMGANLGVSFGFVDTAIVLNKISDNNFVAIESGIMYTDWQQGYANYEPSSAIGGIANIKLSNDLSLKLATVKVNSLENRKRDDFIESNIDFQYKIDKSSKLRLRYSIKDQSELSDREDRNDFRVIYYRDFRL